MIARLSVCLLASLLAVLPATHSAAQDAQKKTQQKAPQKKAEPKAQPKSEKKAEPKKTEQKKSSAGSPTLVAQFGDWGVYVNKAAKTCFALSQPKERQPANVKRNPAYFFVTTKPEEKLVNEVNILVGFDQKEGTAVNAAVGAGTNFAMFVRKQGLWIKDPADEAKLLDAMKKEKELTLRLTPASGAATTDRYSLSGFPQALDRVAKECP
ncbi:MAG: Invasion associated locus B family protein [Xanthobacteraceae bacterium]|nr:Invasion associated locus B family protein [Xanthobacteraceae bacterium]QYK44923.1 MAG: Invasion associated locus B family protein [Xanthobacteraceae bacterium]